MRRWTFKTAQFTVRLDTRYECNYRYDGDDEDGEIQAKLDSGEYVAFESSVLVTYDGEVIGCDHLGGSIYAADTMAEFWTAHRDPDPMNRNCTLMRQARGGSPDAKHTICHYFPGMVSEAVRMARETIQEKREALETLPRLRAA